MRRVFAKGLDCLHLLLGCNCPPQPITMRLRTPFTPARSFAVLCAVYTAHGRAVLRERYPFVSDAMEKRIQLACGYCMPKHGIAPRSPRGLLVESSFTIHADGRVTDKDGEAIGHIAPLAEVA